MTNPLNPNDAGATVTFDDEFNSLSLWNGTSGTWDTTYIFASPTGNGSTLASNGEQEWYINSNYAPTDSVKPWTVNNGILTITAAPASAAIQPLINGYQYTSGQLNTSQSFSQTYGYFEMTAKLPAGQGMWPAFWLLPESGAWPPEIDAMEVLGNNPSTLYTSVHSGTASDEISSDQANTVANTSTSFNTYGVDWEPNFITWYFDGQPVYQVATPAALQNIPMYMIVNLAVGGGWPGDVNSTTPMPAQMQIEDVRAFASLPDAAYLAAEAVTATPGTLDQTAAATYTVPAGVQDVQLIGTASQTVTANSLGDVITSNDYGSTLIGGSGNDTLIAGHRADVLTGGGGDNVFEFNYLPWNAGQITDFQVGSDTLDLSALLSAAGYTGSNAVADGYVSFVSNGAGGTEVLFNSHSASDPWPTLITTLDGVAPTGLTAANVLGEAGASSLPTTVIQTDTNAFGSVSLTEVGNNFFLYGTDGSDPTLQCGGTDAVVGGFGGWEPIGAVQTAGGYEVAFDLPGTDLYTAWTTDSNGNYLSNIPAVSGTSSTLENLELTFNQDLNGDGTIGPTKTVIQTDTGAFGSTSLVEVANQYYFYNSEGTGPVLQYDGTDVVAGGFGGWMPIGAVQTASGYEVAFDLPGTDLYTAWATDSNGNYLSSIPAVSGTSSTLENLELTFNQDLNGDGTIGPAKTVIQTDTNAFGSVSLTEVGNNFFLYGTDGSDPTLQCGGTDAVVGGFGGWEPIGAVQTAGGYEVAFDLPGTDLYTAWTTDSNGNYLSNIPAVSGTSSTLENLELTFNQDLNGDGTIGPTKTVIQTDTGAFGSTSLVEVANQYYFYNSEGTGPVLQYDGTDVVAGGFGGWMPIGAVQTASGYEVAFDLPGTDLYTAWATDSNGNYLSSIPAVSGTSSTLENLELTFNQDLNGDGTIGPPIIQTAAPTYTMPSNVTDVVLTGTAAQTVTGNSLNDIITSNDYGSTLIAGSGNDTLIAGHGADVLTGGAGSDTFEFNYQPWNAGKITNFNPATDVLDLHGLFAAVGYHGTNPVADGYLSFVSDGAGDTKVIFDPQGPSTTIPIQITTLEHVSPASLQAHTDWIF